VSQNQYKKSMVVAVTGGDIKSAASGSQAGAVSVGSMNSTTLPPKTRLAPTEIAKDTFVIHDHAGEGVAPALVPMNAMVIRGAEPVVVDTGLADNREWFFEDLFSIVEPGDIRWIFISHDDIDHTGNLNELLAAAPNATVVVNWFLAERMGSTLDASPLRQRWVDDDQVLDVGDRRLLAVRPPVYDSPTTRGLYDTSTGVYWASDAFGAPMLTPIADSAALDDELFDLGMSTFSRYVAPWIDVVDTRRYEASVDRVATLNPTVIAGCHNPIIRGSRVDRALELVRNAPTAVALPAPDQAVLETIQAQFLSMAS